MTQTSPSLDHSLARRAVLKGAGLGVGAGLVGGFAATAQAQTTGAGLEPAADGPIWSAEYWAKKGDVALNLWRKRAARPGQASHRCRCCSWCTAPRTRRAPPTISPCRARASTRS
jgi:hypothetical protein